MNRSLPASFRHSALALAVSSLYLLSAPASAASTPGPIAGEFLVNSTVGTYQRVPAVAIDADGDFVVAWDSTVDNNSDIVARRYNSAGAAKGGEFQVNTTVAGNQTFPAIAIDADGDFVVTWYGYGSSGAEVFARRYNAAGAPQGGEFQVNTTTTSDQFAPRIAMDANGNFVVTWLSNVNGSYQIFARRYNAGGVAQGGEFRVNTTRTYLGSYPTVAVDADGDFVVAWEGVFENGNEIIVRPYNANGVPKSIEFRVDTTDSGYVSSPSVAIDAGGDFVVAWTRHVGGNDEVIARRYDAAGAAQGGEFKVNTTNADLSADAEIAMDADGDFVVSWFRSIGTRFEVMARRYSAAGVAQGGEFQVNTTVTNRQTQNSVALDADGDFVVAWSADVDGSSTSADYEIFARRYQGTDSVDVALTQTDSADPAAVGSPLTYTFTASNLRSPASTTGIAAIDTAIGSVSGLRVVDTFPAGSTAVSGSGVNWSCVAVFGGLLNCVYAPPLRAGQQANPLLVKLTPPNSPGAQISSTGQLSANQLDANQPNNRDVETTQLVPTVRFNIATASASEATATTVRVQLSAASTQTVTVPYVRASLGSNVPSFPGDYRLSLPSPITFNPGEVEKQLVITPVDDRFYENDEIVSLTLGTPTNALRGSITNHQRTIVDNDPRPAP